MACLNYWDGSTRVNVTKKISDIIARDKKVIMTTTRSEIPFVPAKGDGDFIYDVSGNKFIDFSSFIAVYNLGVNSSKAVHNAITSQAGRLMHSAFTDFYAEPPVRFAENLLTMFPKGFGRVFYSNSGTEANEAALKFSKLFTKRQYVLSFYNSFHGRTYGSLSMTSSRTVQREHFGPFNSAVHAPYAYCYRCPFGQEYPSCGMACVDYIKKYPLSKDVSPKEVAAIFVEPIQGEGGYVVPPKEFIAGLREIASDNGMALVSDEVQAGYLRAGKFLCMDNFGVEADIYTMAKAVGAGLPIGVTVTRSSLGSIRAGAHANTFGGNLVSIAAAEAQLTYVKNNLRHLEAESRQKGRHAMKRLEEMKERYELIGDVRGIALMIGMELVKSKKTKEPAASERDRVIRQCFENGLILLPAGDSSIRIIPPITVSQQSLDRGLSILEEAISSVNKSVG
ncbi:MAG: aminotransferase class III-fold pyridoxal phosphate-dependent enzyme [Candidatus Micrarchaeota archaeon]|nr:aminotransferase class III-fold pyridoxal phosphate-dependent enzyme [Candidatus Micrarchaeota archaeon]